ncbi:MAG: PIN domain-containing protein [Desulfobacteraceae bacterium]|jgi:predicted nucleic acid-binding protein
MKDKVFVDTNILVYAHDLDAGERYEKANKLILGLWESGTAVISTQVLQEFYVTLTRKIPKPLTVNNATGVISSYISWDVITNKPENILMATELEYRYKISFWDALIVSAAYEGNVKTILTEDLNHGQYIEGIKIENPFMDGNC